MDMLPNFNEHEGHTKLVPLDGPTPPNESVQEWVARTVGDRDRSTVRVLDVGCGRGGTVAWLVEQGFDAYGLDVGAGYIANGLAYLGEGRLFVLNGDRYPFPDDYFDFVISDQVFEHVADLDQLAREVARITKLGGGGLHIFPAKWILVEPHMLMPMVHWLPKGPARRRAIRLALRTGRAAPYFTDHTLDERVQIYADYSESETFYRRPSAIGRTLGRHGLRTDVRRASRERVLKMLGDRRVPAPADRLAAWAYRTVRVMYLTTEKVHAPAG
jgi:SAM-dependent methyltransferase